MVWRTKVLLIFSFFFPFFVVFFYICYSKFVSMEDMLWIEDIVGNTRAPLFLTKFKINMVVKRSAISTFPSARKGSGKKKNEKRRK